LDADVSLLVVKNFIKSIREKAVGYVIEQGQDPSNVLLTIIKEELISILGKKTASININQKVTKIMMVGLQGSGKTTTCAKIANYYKTKFNKKPLLVGVDIYRPAAIEQLRDLASQIDVDFFEKGTQDPVKTVQQANEFAEKNDNDFIIYDTAGRLQTNEELMQELKNIRNKVSPNEILLVVDAMSGQDILNVAKEFNDVLTLSGFIITKLDGDARAGAALSIISLLDLPVKFTGTGEKVGSLDIFHPERIADRILGLGDIMTLAEKANEVVDQNKIKKTFTRMLSGKMDLEDSLTLMQQMSKLGSMGSILKMIPNMPSINDSQIGDAEEKKKI
jgi:signal recognition particle subunit SRP54